MAREAEGLREEAQTREALDITGRHQGALNLKVAEQRKQIKFLQGLLLRAKRDFDAMQESKP